MVRLSFVWLFLFVLEWGNRKTKRWRTCLSPPGSDRAPPHAAGASPDRGWELAAALPNPPHHAAAAAAAAWRERCPCESALLRVGFALYPFPDWPSPPSQPLRPKGRDRPGRDHRAAEQTLQPSPPWRSAASLKCLICFKTLVLMSYQLTPASWVEKWFNFPV